MAQVGVEPTASLVLSESGLPIAYRANFSRQLRGLESNQHQRVQSPMSYRLDDPGIKAHRSAVFKTAAIANWLALLFQLRRQESNLQSSP